MDCHSSKELMIGGVKVHFPCKPYPSQLSMMSKIIKGLQNGKHCLLESPTGSGKTLALLCSALAWQEDVRSKIESEVACCSNDSDCQNEKDNSINDCEGCASSKENVECNKPNERKKVPTVWFGTRTHKQIAQITHELARTKYKNLKMTILSSREQSCIHPINEKSSNKNDGCRDLLRGKHDEMIGSRCSFYQNVHRMRSHESLYSCGLTSAWDLEDFVKLGRRVRACPYFSSRELIPFSAIVFCPYNYLVDPGLRSQMNINLKGQIVILDEAHNIEDCSRDAVSNTLNETELINTISDLDHLIADEVKIEQHKPLHLLCTKIGQWLQVRAATLAETSYETWSQIWNGKEFLTCLAEWGITADTLPVLQKCFQEAVSVDEEEEEEVEYQKILHSTSKALLGGLFHILSYLLLAEESYVQDYRIAIIRHAEYGVPPPKRTRDGWITMNKRSTRYYSVNLHFWCLNPAVAFKQLASAHSIILTSGTLSPMQSFSSELGLSFPIQLEASHVISDGQVWVGTIGSGPNGQHLQATFQNTNALNFQDELGKLILEVCTVVPHGVLCFFSSYKMLEKLCERWENTGLWRDLCQKKAVFSEPHGKNKSSFQEVMQSFYEYTSGENAGDRSGALLLAVCRGKISEGIDFSDNNARAVITVGIPFPNWKDQQVELKRKYNDEHSKNRGLLSGSDWYEIQAFRALNQALGRCIRHKSDWGALVIVDDRFCKNPKRYCKGLSKWVRSKVKTYVTFQSANDSLASFCQALEQGLSFEKSTDKGNHSVDSMSTFDGHDSVLDQTVPNSFTAPSYSQDHSIYVGPSCHKDSLASDNAVRSVSRLESEVSLKQSISFVDKKINGTVMLDQSMGKVSTTAINERKEANISKICGVKSLDFEDDVIVIPSTPQKPMMSIIVPESPLGLENGDFEEATSSKRKGRAAGSPKSMSHRLAKKCKQSLTFEPSKRAIDDSQELFAPRTRRRRSLRANRKDERQQQISNYYKVDASQSGACKQTVLCASCQASILSSKAALKQTTENFFYIDTAFPHVKSFHSLPSSCKLELEKAVSSNNTEIVLDTVWCSTDQLAYQFYLCNCCRTTVGFCIVNSQRYTDFYIFPAAVTVSSTS